MKWFHVGLVMATALCVFSGPLGAQSPFLPSTIGIDVGLGPGIPSALEPSCPGGLPVVAGAHLGWSVRRAFWLQATASTYGNGAKASCGDAVPCERGQLCPTATGIGPDLTAVGMRLLFEPLRPEAGFGPQLGVGIGRLMGDGETYSSINAAIRYTLRPGLRLTVGYEALLFHAPVDVRDHWTGTLLSSSRDLEILSLIRVGIEWGS